MVNIQDIHSPLVLFAVMSQFKAGAGFDLINRSKNIDLINNRAIKLFFRFVRNKECLNKRL